MDLANLHERWAASWPGCLPHPESDVLSRYRDRWVRFWSLPEGKRYPDTSQEWAEVLHRYNTVLTDLVATNSRASGRVTLVTCSFHSKVPGRESAVPIPFELRNGDDDATLWMCVPDDEEPDELWTNVWVSDLRWSPGRLDGLLRCVADDETAGVIVCDPEAEWLYHPYDGGADVIAPTVERRNEIATRWSAWASTHPAGL